MWKLAVSGLENARYRAILSYRRIRRYFVLPLKAAEKHVTLVMEVHMSYNTVSKVVSILVDDGILEQTDKSGKAKIFSYTEYLDILRKDT